MAKRSLDISLAAQRSIRFVVGVGIIVWELVIQTDHDPSWQALLVGTAFAGLPIANIIDEVRTARTPPSAPETVEVPE